jgi:hypothetical protein
MLVDSRDVLQPPGRSTPCAQPTVIQFCGDSPQGRTGSPKVADFAEDRLLGDVGLEVLSVSA